MLRITLAGVLLLVAPLTAEPAPPTPSRETTYFVGPLVDGWVDYAAALDAAFGDADAPPEENAFAGLLDVIDLSSVAVGHEAALRERLGLPPGGDPRVELDYVEHAEPPASRCAPSSAGFDRVGEDGFGGGEGFGRGFGEQADQAERPPDAADRVARATAAPWDNEGLPDVAVWLESIGPALDAAAAALDRPAWFAPIVRETPDRLVFASILPHLGATRRLSNAFLIRGMQRLGGGDAAGAARDWRSVQRLSRLATREPTMVASLVATSNSARIRPLLAALLASPHTSLADLEVLADLPERAPMSRIVAVAERAIVLDWLQVLRRTGARSMDLGASMDGVIDALSNPGLDFESALRGLNARWDRWFADAPMDHAGAEARAAGIERELEERSAANEASLAAGEHADPNALAEAVVDFSLGFSAPAIAASLRTERTALAFQQVETVAIAAASFRLGRGELPAALADLVPRFLPAPPLDPFDGQPLRYAHDANGFAVWSVGPDGEDDGGVDGVPDGDLVLRVTR